MLAFHDIEHTAIRCLDALARARLTQNSAATLSKALAHAPKPGTRATEGNATLELLRINTSLPDLLNIRNPAAFVEIPWVVDYDDP